ncbi:Solitary outer membrane autotransporter beta-barrel domain [Vibrio sp. 99-70-13A1]|uniref:Solitary outer membrane autotransporter beta-barrel domain n=1 Tax=Vibrio sp. 99-70-13A1 TaxID=2607601 RepID=UPI0014935961|nr:Solitary outer membrane autotransporter beta-barrel domain [Vibrio sp. 99-70-13A1]NOH99308.1 Solitary outer membrane autotransporter beta-barrel domain [Vibrio sp. 99-70-13A1]
MEARREGKCYITHILIGICAFNILILSEQAKAALNVNKAARDLLESRFATSIILTDSDAIEFGIKSFDPNGVFHTQNDDLGNQRSLENRKEKSVYALPLTYHFDIEGSPNRSVLMLKAFAIDTEEEVSLINDSQPKDTIKELTLGGSVGYGYEMHLADGFTFTPSVTSHLIYYKNTYDARSPFSELFEQTFDGLLLNTSAWSNIFETAVALNYDLPTSWGKWHFGSQLKYFYGYTWGEARDAGNPHGGYVTNQATAFIDIYDQKQTIFAGIKRIDMSDELVLEFGSNHYYEASFGWLFNNPTKWDWVDNIGLGVNFNYGSNLKGGSIVLYYNKM